MSDIIAASNLEGLDGADLCRSRIAVFGCISRKRNNSKHLGIKNRLISRTGYHFKLNASRRHIPNQNLPEYHPLPPSQGDKKTRPWIFRHQNLTNGTEAGGKQPPSIYSKFSATNHSVTPLPLNYRKKNL